MLNNSGKTVKLLKLRAVLLFPKTNWDSNKQKQMEKIKSYSEFIGEKSGVTESKKDVAGFKEVIEVVGLGKMKAKLDTGNTAYNAIICQDYFEKDGNVKFDYNGKEYEYPVVKHVRIWHHGKSTERPVIKVDLIFNGKTYKDELVDLKISDLTGTRTYRSRMLLCKKFMEKANVIIDPSKDFNLTDEKEIKKERKKKKINESKDAVSMKIDDNGDAIDIEFFIENDKIGGAIITEQYIDDIIDEYTESVDDFNESVFKKFDDFKKIYNLEDFWVNKEFRGNGYSRMCLEKLMEEFGDKQMTLRAFPDGDVNEETLVKIYSEFGFVVLQPTKKDGTIMGKFIK